MRRINSREARKETRAILVILIIIIFMIILISYNYFSGDQPSEEKPNGHGTLFSSQQAGWSSGQRNSFA
jgi:hypothetical protein